MPNTLDLDPEWGALDLITEVEEAFAIEIADDEAECCWTVGDVYDLIFAHTPDWDMHDGSCASSAVFYRLRRALVPEEKAALTPRSSLQRTGMSVSRLFNSLERSTGLRLPSADATAIGVIGSWMFIVGCIGVVIAFCERAWMLSGIGALVVATGALFVRMDPARLPAGMTTVGDLVRRTAQLNTQKLKEAGVRQPDRWSVLVALAAEHSYLRPDQIRPETFLMREGMKLATARY